MNRIPRLVIQDVITSCQANYEAEREALEEAFSLRMKQLDKRRVSYSNLHCISIYFSQNH